jgi:hypothetical protein
MSSNLLCSSGESANPRSLSSEVLASNPSSSSGESNSHSRPGQPARARLRAVIVLAHTERPMTTVRRRLTVAAMATTTRSSLRRAPPPLYPAIEAICRSPSHVAAGCPRLSNPHSSSAPLVPVSPASAIMALDSPPSAFESSRARFAKGIAAEISRSVNDAARSPAPSSHERRQHQVSLPRAAISSIITSSENKPGRRPITCADAAALREANTESANTSKMRQKHVD